MIRNRSSESGFTLIELLIVIVIIGILAGVVLAVIDPAAQQKKAKETVMRTTVEKACLALSACGQTSTDANNCDTASEMGVATLANLNGTPTGSNYYIGGAAGARTSNTDSNTTAASSTADIIFRGVLGTCKFQCDYDFSTSTMTALQIAPIASPVPVCVIGAQ